MGGPGSGGPADEARLSVRSDTSASSSGSSCSSCSGSHAATRTDGSRATHSYRSSCSSCTGPGRGPAFSEDSAAPSRRLRTDSEIARDLERSMNGRGVDHPEDEDFARNLHNALNEPDSPGVLRVSSNRREIEDADLAQAILSAEMADLADQARATAHIMANDRNDYMRPRNHTPWFCRIILALTSFMMFVEIAKNGFKFEDFAVNPTIGPSVDTLLALGAKETSLILDGQFFRLFTPMLLHAGIIHLLFNMLGLWNIGFPAEREFGWRKIGAIYVLSGVFGVLLSSIFLPQQVGVGASGAIFGLFGSAWADLIHNWSLYRGQAYCVLAQLTVATLINMSIGLMPFLDNFAHIGGFLSGLILGFTLLVQNRYDVMGYRKARLNYQLVLQVLAITIIPIFFVMLLIILYAQVDVASSCDWCASLSCVPMPPGADDTELWWDCSECSQTELQIINVNDKTGAYDIVCPNGELVTVESGQAPDLTFADLKENNRLIITACKRFCLGEER